MAKESGGKNSPVAHRVRLLRERLGFKLAKPFAEHLGVDYNVWNNIENGHPLSKEVAFTIVRRVPGVTLDWLYLGNPAGLTLERANLLAAPPDEPAGKTTTRA